MRRRTRTSASIVLIVISLFALSWGHTASGQAPTESTESPLPQPDPELTPEPIESPPPAEDPKSEPPPDKGGSPPAADPEDDSSGSPDRTEQGHDRPTPTTLKDLKDRDGLDRTRIWWSLRPSVAGIYDTGRLESISTRLKELGKDVPKTKLFAPFLIAGKAEWSDTWGQVRRAHGDELRPHLGQDVYCDIGTPVLAIEGGEIQFTTDPLGGMVARLHRKVGGYFYYGHLARWNTQDFSSGDNIKAGDVIGYCGISGNARTTPPHVHFGWIAGGFNNPMLLLVDRLHTAERQAAALLARVRKERIQDRDATTTARLYGERFLPNLSTITCVASVSSVISSTGVVELVEDTATDCAGA